MSDEHGEPRQFPLWLSEPSSWGAALEKFLKDKRWFAGKAETIRSVDIRDCLPLGPRRNEAFLLMIRLRYGSGSVQNYSLPLKMAPPAEIRAAPETNSSRYLTIERGEERVILFDALEDREFAEHLLRSIGEGAEAEGVRGKLVSVPTSALSGLLSVPGGIEPSVLKVEQSNTSIKYGDKLILKFFRRAEEGVNLDLETGRFLTEKARFEHVPPVAGSIEYRREGKPPVTLALLQGFVRNRGDAWKYTLEMLDEYLGRVGDLGDLPVAIPSITDMADSEPPRFAREVIGAYLSSAAVLGRNTAGLHLALASDRDDPDFAPEPFTAAYRESLARDCRRLADQARRLLEERFDHLDAASQDQAAFVLSRWEETFGRTHRLLDQPITAERTRVHGDYHLGQVLFTGSDFVIIDFEGEPERPLAERRAKHSPLRDIAGMLRSFHYAASSAVLRRAGRGAAPPSPSGPLLRWARLWTACVSASFLRAYLETAGRAAFIPRGRDELRALLEIFLLEKTAYELIYELSNRPDWALIPLDGIAELAEKERQASPNG